MTTQSLSWTSRASRWFSYYACICFNSATHNIRLDKDVREAHWKNTQPFVPDIKACKVIKVYDGDTITVAAKLHASFPVNRFSVRLSGIDTPEMRSSNENEKKRAVIAKKFLEDKLLNQTVVLDNVSIEKYGRLLATVYHNGVDINELMVQNNYAVRYGGGTKVIPPEWSADT